MSYNAINLLLARGVPSADVQNSISSANNSNQSTVVQPVAGNLNATVTPVKLNTFTVSLMLVDFTDYADTQDYMLTVVGSAYYKIRITKIGLSCSSHVGVNHEYINLAVNRFTLTSYIPAQRTVITPVGYNIVASQATAMTFILSPTTVAGFSEVITQRVVCVSELLNAIPQTTEIVFGASGSASSLTLTGATDAMSIGVSQISGVVKTIIAPAKVGSFHFYIEYTEEPN